jgi:anaerobic ribonucleoside-triphosphate reductase activating protein
MRYHDITKDDMKNGDGLRVVLWLSGCDHACSGCQNPMTWDPDDGLVFDDKAKDELFSILGREYISGITLSGGDPLYPGNRNEVFELLKEIRDRFPEKTVWLYTGYNYEDIKDFDHLKYVDVLVDGLYLEEKKDNGYHWAGSTNQRVIDVPESLKSETMILHKTEELRTENVEQGRISNACCS